MRTRVRSKVQSRVSGIAGHGGGGRPPSRAPLAFTSAGDGNWNTVATWTNGVYTPNLLGDTVTIAAGHEVTVPAGLAVSIGATAFTAGTNTSSNRTKLIINGTFNLGASIVLPTITSIEMGPGGVLDLKGFSITQSAVDVKTVFAGSAGSHATVKSTGGRGAINLNSNTTVATWDYVDCSGLGNSQFARSHGATPNGVHFEHCTFSDMDDWYIDGTNATANASVDFQFNDVRNPHTANAISAGILFSSQALGSGTRIFANNTFSSGAVLGNITLTGVLSLTFQDNIIDRAYVKPSALMIPTHNFHSNLSGDDQAFSFTGSPISSLTNSYFYYEGGNHVFGGNPNTAITATGNVFEVPQNTSYAGMNWALYGASITVGITIQNNLWIGAGTPLSITGASSPAIDFSNNTWYGSNQFSTAPGLYDFGMVETEQVANLSGTFNYYNNLIVVPDTHPGGGAQVTDPHITLRNAVGTQITSANYNGKAGYDHAGAYDSTVICGYWQNRGGSTIAGLGVNDVNADPLFVDKARGLAKWDLSLGGPGTAANAIAEMLKLNGYGGTFNSAYSLTALLTYVKAGFQPTGAGATAYNGTGSAGANIGFR